MVHVTHKKTNYRILKKVKREILTTSYTRKSTSYKRRVNCIVHTKTRSEYIVIHMGARLTE